jgi:hemerythrin
MDAVPLEWTSALEVGIADIDAQHRELFARLARVRDAAFSGETSEVERTIGFLVDYVGFHFQAEEHFMAAQRYPGIERHREEHVWLLRAVEEIAADHASRGPSSDSVARLERFLADWLRNHIGVTDLAMARFVRRARPR